MTDQRNPIAAAVAVAAAAVAAVSLVSWSRAARPVSASAETSCREFMAPKMTVDGRAVGQEDCRMREAEASGDPWPDVTRVLGPGGPYVRLDMGVTGTVAGYVVRTGPRISEFTDAPEFVFAQAGNPTTPVKATLRVEAEKGNGLTLLYPRNAGTWNGKLYVTVHGMGSSFRKGTMKAWDKRYDPASPLGDLTKFEKVMLLKGYALAITHRNSESTQLPEGDYTATLADGTTLEGKSTGDHARLVIDFALLARNAVKARLGRMPSHIYWYGKSGGARLGRLVSFMGDVNLDAQGKPIIDGMIWDDAGAGLWVPVVMKGGKNILFDDPASRGKFVKSIEVVHQLYNAERNDPVPAYVSTNFLANKRETALILRAKGLDDRFRSYEVRQVSHSGGETLPDGKRDDVQILPLWHAMDAFIDVLDAWVDADRAAPATKSDDPRLGDVNGDGLSEHAAIALPPVACPLGVYFQFPRSRGLNGIGTTGFASFDGADLEPLDGRTLTGKDRWFTQFAFADMNANGYRDRRETVTAAWRRLGLLRRDETFGREKYAACVAASVDGLRRERLLTAKVAAAYIEEAARTPLPAWAK